MGQKLSNSDVLQHAKRIVAEAQKVNGSKVKGGKKKGNRGGKAGQQSKEVKELISNAVCLMQALQICADRSLNLPAEAVSLAVDMLLQQLKPKSDKNKSLYNNIRNTIETIKTQL